MILVEGQDYTVRVVPFPNGAADGATMSHPDMPCVYINANISNDRKRKALKHELEHIANDDLYSEESAFLIEVLMNG